MFGIIQYIVLSSLACWYPPGLYLIDNISDIELCKTIEEENFARENAFDLMEKMESQSETSCPRKCRQTFYKVTVIREPNAEPKHHTAVVFLGSRMKSEHQEDVVIYDINNVVASVGGSLGLFLGVSCYSMITYVCIKFVKET